MPQAVKLGGGHEIFQEDSYFKLTQDSVLLGDFAHVGQGERAIDLGAGVGCLGVLLMLRDPGAVDGVEIDPGAAALAEENYARCGLSARGRVRVGDFRALPAEMSGRYDVCLSNPPYLKPGSGPVAMGSGLAAARTALSGGVEELCRAACRVLKAGGRFYLCYRPAGLDSLMTALHGSLLAPKRMRLVHHSPKNQASLVLLEARRDRACELVVMPPLFVVDETGRHTAEYRRIYGEHA